MRGPSPENSENFCPLAGQREQAETSSTVLETENARPSCWPEVARLVRLICVISASHADRAFRWPSGESFREIPGISALSCSRPRLTLCLILVKNRTHKDTCGEFWVGFAFTSREVRPVRLDYIDVGDGPANSVQHWWLKETLGSRLGRFLANRYAEPRWWPRQPPSFPRRWYGSMYQGITSFPSEVQLGTRLRKDREMPKTFVL